MLIGVPREMLYGETRVAATPKTVEQIKKLNKMQGLKRVLKIVHLRALAQKSAHKKKFGMQTLFLK